MDNDFSRGHKRKRAHKLLEVYSKYHFESKI